MRLFEILIGGFAKIFFPYKIARRNKKSVTQAVRSDWHKIGNDFRKVIQRG